MAITLRSAPSSKSWLADHQFEVIDKIKKHLPEASQLVFKDDQLSGKYKHWDISYPAKDILSWENFAKSINTDLFFLHLTEQQNDGKLDQKLSFKLTGTNYTTLEIDAHVGHTKKNLKVDLALDEKIYNYATGKFNLQKFEEKLKEQCPEISPVPVFRGASKEKLSATEIQVPFLPLLNE